MPKQKRPGKGLADALSLRLDPSDIKRADALVGTLARSRSAMARKLLGPVTRSTILRAAVRLGLDELESRSDDSAFGARLELAQVAEARTAFEREVDQRLREFERTEAQLKLGAPERKVKRPR